MQRIDKIIVKQQRTIIDDDDGMMMICRVGSVKVARSVAVKMSKVPLWRVTVE